MSKKYIFLNETDPTSTPEENEADSLQSAVRDFYQHITGGSANSDIDIVKLWAPEGQVRCLVQDDMFGSNDTWCVKPVGEI